MGFMFCDLYVSRGYKFDKFALFDFCLARILVKIPLGRFLNSLLTSGNLSCLLIVQNVGPDLDPIYLTL